MNFFKGVTHVGKFRDGEKAGRDFAEKKRRMSEKSAKKVISKKKSRTYQ
jgi:hypothetical protein